MKSSLVDSGSILQWTGSGGEEREESKMTPSLSNCLADGGMVGNIVKYLIVAIPFFF